ncbi:hypothetical protein [Rhodoferax koreensis]|nr:hypothetical protein [Rhodoferax koreense]
MAWSCRAPSAWGSNMTGNLTKSQAANPGQKFYTDETWTVTNWATNTARSNTGFTAAPWVQLKSIRSNIYYGIDSSVADADKYKYVTMSALVSNLGIVLPPGVSGSTPVVTVLTTADDFTKAIITAQLNYFFPSSANQMNTCIVVRGQNQLPLMASGTYTPAGGGAPWDKTQILTYLRGNYIAKP